MPETLLDASFVRELDVLYRRLEVRARSGRAGEKVSRRRGSSVEFQEHRAYVAGDDLRRVDWAAYARTGEPVLKLFRADEDVVVRVVLDTSASMGVGTPSKLWAGQRLAAAIGYLALARSERAQLVAASEGVDRMHAPRRGKSGLAPLLGALGAVTASGGTDLAAAIASVQRRVERPGMLVVVSDFFDAGPVLTALSRASAAGHEVAMVQVLAEEDLEPALDGDLALTDVETGEAVEVTIDAAALEAYGELLERLFETLRRQARRTRGTYVRARPGEALEDVVRRFVGKEVD